LDTVKKQTNYSEILDYIGISSLKLLELLQNLDLATKKKTTQKQFMTTLV